MTYRQLAAEFFYGCFQAGLCVELFVCKMIGDTFGWVSKKFEFLCQDGMQQMARLRSEPSLLESTPPAQWPRRVVHSWEKLSRVTGETPPRTDARGTFPPPAPRGSAA